MNRQATEDYDYDYDYEEDTMVHGPRALSIVECQHSLPMNRGSVAAVVRRRHLAPSKAGIGAGSSHAAAIDTAAHIEPPLGSSIGISVPARTSQR